MVSFQYTQFSTEVVRTYQVQYQSDRHTRITVTKKFQGHLTLLGQTKSSMAVILILNMVRSANYLTNPKYTDHLNQTNPELSVSKADIQNLTSGPTLLRSKNRLLELTIQINYFINCYLGCEKRLGRRTMNLNPIQHQEFISLQELVQSPFSLQSILLSMRYSKGVAKKRSLNKTTTQKPY